LIDLFILKHEQLFRFWNVDTYEAAASDWAFTIFPRSVRLIVPQIDACGNHAKQN
jgi:hypothetical protein